jgi:hypothetical protein
MFLLLIKAVLYDLSSARLVRLVICTTYRLARLVICSTELPANLRLLH